MRRSIVSGDQLVLWLLAGRDFIPNRQFSFRPNSANIMLGEKAHFRLTMRQPDPRVKSVPLKLFLGETEVARVNMTAGASDANRLAAEYLPEKVGRYRALASFPDGTSQESRFIVFNENVGGDRGRHGCGLPAAALRKQRRTLDRAGGTAASARRVKS